MISRRTPLLLLTLAACESASRSTPTPADPPPAPPIVRPAPRSCPTDGAPQPLAFDPRLALGAHAGVTWLFGHTAQGPALAHLGADDTLALTPVPLPDVAAGTIAGARIWLLAASPSLRALTIDITDPAHPVVGAVTPVTTGAAIDRPVSLAVGDRRALTLLGAPGKLDLVLLDAATLTSVAPPHPLDLTSRPLHSLCGPDTCSLLSFDNTSDTDPLDGVVVTRVTADGARERELVAGDAVGEPAIARHGDNLLVAWPTDSGVRLRALDTNGHPLAPAVPVPWDSNRPVRAVRLFPGDAAVVLAVGEDDRWSVAPVGPHANPGPLRPLPGASHHALRAAPLADGLAWLDLGEDIPPDDAMDSLVVLRSWRADIVGGFLPTTAAAAAPVRLAGVEGSGHGTLEPHLLTRPGAAAALIVPRGDAGGVYPPSFTLLRATCRPAADPRTTPLAPPLTAPGDSGCRDEPEPHG